MRAADLTSWAYVGDVFTEETLSRGATPSKEMGTEDLVPRRRIPPLLHAAQPARHPRATQHTAIGVATAPSPLGTGSGAPLVGPRRWTPPGEPERYRTVIDADVFTAAPDGQRYLYYGCRRGPIVTYASWPFKEDDLRRQLDGKARLPTGLSVRRSVRLASGKGVGPASDRGTEDAGPTSPSAQITDAKGEGLTTGINRSKIHARQKSMLAEYRGPMRRCEACDGAGHYEWTDVRLCAVRPEFGVGRPLRIECPACAGRGWLSEPNGGSDEPRVRP